MKAVVLRDGKPEFMDVELGPLSNGWSRIRVAKAGLCGTDIAKISSSVLPASHTEILGHEFVGQVEDPNGNIEVNRGDWIVGMPLVPCELCEHCLQQHPNLCSKAEAIGRTINGSFAEYVDVPFRSMIKIDEPHEAYVLSDPLAVCVHASADTVSCSNQKCLVVGDGTIGCLLAWLLRSRGYDTWIKGIHQQQLRFMEERGVNVINTETPAGFFDNVYETVGRSQSETLIECLHAVRRGGKIVVLGVFAPGYIFPLNARNLFIGEVRLIGANAYIPSEFQQAVSLIRNEKEVMNDFISHRFPLFHFQKALLTARMKQNFTMKIVLETGDAS
jgi:L-iditol 2-dehydrogenase